MEKRKGITPSVRWSVFARDGFICRYCGAQAGQAGVELHADHVVSIAEGGNDHFDNLVTACGKCNGGKGARSIQDAPTSGEVVERIQERTWSLLEQAKAIERSIKAERLLNQAAINLKCSAYGVDDCEFENNEIAIVKSMCREFGADVVLEWYQIAARKVSQYKAIRYVCGIARKHREKTGQEFNEDGNLVNQDGFVVTDDLGRPIRRAQGA